MRKLSVLLALAIAGCPSPETTPPTDTTTDTPPGGEPTLLDIGAAQFVAGTAIDNPYFPLPVGASWVYEAQTPDGLEHDETLVSDAVKIVDGVEAVVVRDEVDLDGVLVEATGDVGHGGEVHSEARSPRGSAGSTFRTTRPVGTTALHRALEADESPEQGVVRGVRVGPLRIGQPLVQAVFGVLDAARDLEAELAQSRGADRDQQGMHGLPPGTEIVEAREHELRTGNIARVGEHHRTSRSRARSVSGSTAGYRTSSGAARSNSSLSRSGSTRPLSIMCRTSVRSCWCERSIFANACP